jgi:DNA-binding NtrC family response regulator
MRVLVADNVMRTLYFSVIPRIATTTYPVLVIGETGVGKELVARRIHELSGRAGDLVAVNCAAVPEHLVESEFFGHERGSFTGAHARRPGYFEQAAAGTLFLDEIAELSCSAQAKLLRALETGEVRAVGSMRDKRFDVRVLAATNRDLEAEVRSGRFREDLYYRLHGNFLRVPALRQRPTEIGLLAKHFLREAAEHAGRAAPRLSEDALAFLRSQVWPGNVRQLRRFMECAAVHATSDVITGEQLGRLSSSAPPAFRSERPAMREPEPPAPPVVDCSLQRESQELERRRILEALERHGGNRTRAAQALGLARTTLVTKLKKLVS